MHCTFSTKQRFPSIEPELESRLWPYIGIADEADDWSLLLGQPSVSRTADDSASGPSNELLGYFNVVRFADSRKRLLLSD